MANTLKFGNGEWYGKKDTILAYNDLNSNYKPLPFNFSRDSKATVINKDGLIEEVGSGQPRIDYLGNTQGALKLEPSRTNYVTQSNDFSGWFKSGAITVTSNYGVSPTGENNSTLLSFSGANNRLYLNTGAAYNNDSVSIYVKGNNGETISFDKSASIGGAKLFTLTGGWDRLESSYNSLSSSRVNIVISTNGGATATNIEVFGIQNEQGSYSTSLINTQGSAVTRLADTCDNGANEQVINSTEGVLYFEGSEIANDGTFKRISVGTSDNLFANSIQLRYNTADNSMAYQFRVGNVYQADITTTINSTNINKIACVWKTNRFEIWINGIKKAEDTSGSVPPSNTFNSLFFGKTSIGLAEAFKGNTKDLRVYNTALTDAQLTALTTI